jgi:hypothetical protein
MILEERVYHHSRRQDVVDCMPCDDTREDGITKKDDLNVREVSAVLAVSINPCTSFRRTLIICPDCGGQFLKAEYRKILLQKTSPNKKAPDVSKGLVVKLTTNH